MPVEIDKPVVVPAAPERVYDKLWIIQQTAHAPSFGACSLNAMLRPYRVVGDLYEFSPTGRLRANDPNLFTLHERKPYAADAIEAALNSMGIAVPEGYPAQMFVMEIVAQAWGALAQAKPPESSSSESSEVSEVIA